MRGKKYRPDLDGPKRPMDDGDTPMSTMPIGRPMPVKNPRRLLSEESRRAAIEMMRRRNGK